VAACKTTLVLILAALMTTVPAAAEAAAGDGQATAIHAVLADGAPASLTVGRARPDPGEMQKLIGRVLLNREAQEVGTVEAVMLDRDGSMSRLIVRITGRAGQADHAVALGWNRIQLPLGGKNVQTYLSRPAVKALPDFVYGDADHRGTVFAAPPRPADALQR
jgi:sporulation protein YlmC with PRC-barrel domain